MSSTEGLSAAVAVYEDAVTAGVQDAASMVAVVDGRVVLARGFGSAASPESIFMMASITKPVTAMALMLLVEEGRVSLTDLACMYLPEFSEGERSRVTVGQLLTHTSGLPDMLPQNMALREARAPLSTFVDETFTTPLLFSPGSNFSYSSMGILLAAVILERISGQAARDFMRERIFLPLSMLHTELGLGPAVRASRPATCRPAEYYASFLLSLDIAKNYAHMRLPPDMSLRRFRWKTAYQLVAVSLETALQIFPTRDTGGIWAIRGAVFTALQSILQSCCKQCLMVVVVCGALRPCER